MDMPVVHAALKKVRDRHCMHKVSCKQFAAGLAQTKGQYSPKIFTVAANHCRGIVISQICEDLIRGSEKRAWRFIMQKVQAPRAQHVQGYQGRGA